MSSTHDYIKDSRNENVQIFVNGKFYHRLAAKISVMDSGYLLGDGIWEGLRLYKNILIHLDDHLDRLYNGANTIAIEIPLTKEEMKEAIFETIKINNMKSDVHIRLIVSRGIKETPYQNPKVTISPPSIVIIPEYKKANEHVKRNGITLGKVNTIRDHQVQDPQINSLSKHNCISACIEANNLGVDEGLMLDAKGYVATCNSTNFFIVKNNEIWTSTGEYCLNGITRQSIIRLCKEFKVPVFEKNFLLEDVHTANEIFVTGTFAGVIPVVSIDNIIVSGGKRGRITKQLQDWYHLDIERLIK